MDNAPGLFEEVFKNGEEEVKEMEATWLPFLLLIKYSLFNGKLLRATWY